jgi:hypothetical protein
MSEALLEAGLLCSVELIPRRGLSDYDSIREQW